MRHRLDVDLSVRFGTVELPKMKVVDADAYLDGGTVMVRIEEMGEVTSIELDYSLPDDGRPRHVTATVRGVTRRFGIGSPEESAACLAVRRCLEQAYGGDAVRNALEAELARRKAWAEHCAEQPWPHVRHEGYVDPYPLPFEGVWESVYDFVEKAHREGKYAF